MKRRDFLKSAAAVAGSISAITSFAGCGDSSARITHLPGRSFAEIIRRLENDYLSVLIFSDGSTMIFDKVNNVHWNTSPVAIQEESSIDLGHVWARSARSFCEQYPGRFAVKPRGDRFQFTLLGRQNQIVGYFLADIYLEDDWLVFRIVRIDDTIPSLVFPPPVICDSLVIPSGIGLWLRDPPESDRFDREFYPFWSDINMRWFGGIKNDACWLAILQRGLPDSGALRVNRSISPVWLKSLRKWKPTYSVRYKFTKGNYVTLAKIYRNWAIENNIFKSLDEKIEANPNLAHFIGGRLLSFFQARPPMRKRDAEDLWLTREQAERRLGDRIDITFTHADVLRHIEKAKSLGFKKGPVILRGWINRGYDASHPDIWPPETALGPIDTLKQIMALPEPIVAGLHDNYQDMYDTTPNFPKGVNIMANGRLMPAGFWAGGQAYAVNSRNGLKYAKRNWQQISTLSPKLMFIDTTTAMQMYQSYENGNTLTRTQDLRYKSELLSFLKQQGVLVGSEESADFGIPHVDWFECRHRRSDQYVPLWPLVFHDAAFIGRYTSRFGDRAYPAWLEDMLWGYMPLLFMDAERRNEDHFKNTFHIDKWHEKIATSEMLDHKFLTEDRNLEQTTFSSGCSIVCNFSDKPQQADGKTVPPYGYITET